MYFSFDVQLLEITTQSSTVIAWLQLAVSCVYFICKYQKKKKKKNNGRHLLQIAFIESSHSTEEQELPSTGYFTLILY